jgi:hypothetical protein
MQARKKDHGKQLPPKLIGPRLSDMSQSSIRVGRQSAMSLTVPDEEKSHIRRVSSVRKVNLIGHHAPLYCTQLVCQKQLLETLGVFSNNNPSTG